MLGSLLNSYRLEPVGLVATESRLKSWRTHSAGLVGRTPRSAADALVGFLGVSMCGTTGPGIRCGSGDPPHWLGPGVYLLSGRERRSRERPGGAAGDSGSRPLSGTEW